MTKTEKAATISLFVIVKTIWFDSRPARMEKFYTLFKMEVYAVTTMSLLSIVMLDASLFPYRDVELETQITT